MTRPKDGAALKGQTQIVEPEWSWLDDRPGKLWRAKAPLPGAKEITPSDRLPHRITAPIIVALSLAAWVVAVGLPIWLWRP